MRWNLVNKNRDFAEEELKTIILKYKNPNSFKKENQDIFRYIHERGLKHLLDDLKVRKSSKANNFSKDDI